MPSEHLTSFTAGYGTSSTTSSTTTSDDNSNTNGNSGSTKSGSEIISMKKWLCLLLLII